LFVEVLIDLIKLVKILPLIGRRRGVCSLRPRRQLARFDALLEKNVLCLEFKQYSHLAGLQFSIVEVVNIVLHLVI